MSKIEHRDGVWYRDGKEWWPDFATTPQIARTEIRRHEARLESTRELLDAWREVRRIQAEEEAENVEERLVAAYVEDAFGYPRTIGGPARRGIRAVRDEVLRMVARGELEVPTDV